MGRYSRTINKIRIDESAPDSLFPRFGRDLSANWHRHISYNIGQLTAEDPLLALDVYTRNQSQALQNVFERLLGQVQHFGLTHGDIVPKNVILPSSGPPVLIDWGSASTGPVPFYDYKRIWLDDAREGFSTDDLKSFATGYGIPVAELLETMKDLLLLDRIDVIRWAIDQRPDRISNYVERAKVLVRSQFP